MKVAFIGLGNMGGPMALNLHKAGHAVTAFDLNQDACKKLQAEGVAIAASAQAAVQGAEAIVTMLPIIAVMALIIALVGRRYIAK